MVYNVTTLSLSFWGIGKLYSCIDGETESCDNAKWLFEYELQEYNDQIFNPIYGVVPWPKEENRKIPP